jgi:hypothetical protein
MPKPVFKTQFTGGKELDQALKDLPAKLSFKAMKETMKIALRPVRDAAENNAKSAGFDDSTGRYSDSFIIGDLNKSQKRKNARNGTYFRGDVYTGSTDRKAHLLEFGHMVWYGIRGQQSRGVKSRFFPVMRPAWDATKEKVLNRFKEFAWQSIAKEAKKMSLAAIRKARKLQKTGKK